MLLLIKVHLDQCARDAQRNAHKVKHHHRIRLEQTVVHERRHSVDQQVRVGAQRKLGAVLPRLQSLAVDEIVQRFPVVERFVAVSDVRPQCGANAGAQKRLEGNVGLGE